MLVWTDLETTGLDSRKECILEVACIVTDDDFNEVARYSNVASFGWARHIVNVFAGMKELGIQPDTAEYNETLKGLARRTDIVEKVLEMHWKNGLWKDCAQCWRPQLFNIDEELSKFIREKAQTLKETKDDKGVVHIETVKPQLAGSTISFDRGFMEGKNVRGDDEGGLPLSLAELHYRNVDVSTFNEIARRHWQAIYASRPNNVDKAHRGMADIEESIRVLKHYMQYLVPAVLP